MVLTTDFFYRENYTGSFPMWHERERALLAPYAMFSRDSQGRRFNEAPHFYRSPFQRDRDRVLHSAAFRRLSGKMQVFTGDMGDYHRTRLTHTHEVASVARTIGRTLRLNEDLIEALALLHDIGHPPYGHCGEDALNELLIDYDGFSHNQFALRLVEQLETRYTPYPGLNLTAEVLAGQKSRTGNRDVRRLLEVQVVDAADSLTYNAHDVDDALKLGLISWSQIRSLDLIQRAEQRSESVVGCIPADGRRQALVHSLIDLQVSDLLESARARLDEVTDLDATAICDLGIRIMPSPEINLEKRQLEMFLFENVYRHPRLIEIRRHAADRLRRLFNRLVSEPQKLPIRFQQRAQQSSVFEAVGEYIAGMTDRFCDEQYRQVEELAGTQATDWM